MDQADHQRYACHNSVQDVEKRIVESLDRLGLIKYD